MGVDTITPVTAGVDRAIVASNSVSNITNFTLKPDVSFCPEQKTNERTKDREKKKKINYCHFNEDSINVQSTIRVLWGGQKEEVSVLNHVTVLQLFTSLRRIQ